MGALQLHTSTIQPFGSDVGANVTTFRLFVHALPIGLREHSTGEMTVGDTPCVGHTNGHGAAPLACQAPPRPWLARVWTPVAPPPGEAAKVKVPSRLMGDVCFAQLQAQRFGIGHVILQHHKPTSPQGHGAGRPTRAGPLLHHPSEPMEWRNAHVLTQFGWCLFHGLIDSSAHLLCGASLPVCTLQPCHTHQPSCQLTPLHRPTTTLPNGTQGATLHTCFMWHFEWPDRLFALWCIATCMHPTTLPHTPPRPTTHPTMMDHCYITHQSPWNGAMHMF